MDLHESLKIILQDENYNRHIDSIVMESKIIRVIMKPSINLGFFGSPRIIRVGFLQEDDAKKQMILIRNFITETQRRFDLPIFSDKIQVITFVEEFIDFDMFRRY
jgi:hypothetical protein